MSSSDQPKKRGRPRKVDGPKSKDTQEKARQYIKKKLDYWKLKSSQKLSNSRKGKTSGQSKLSKQSQLKSRRGPGRPPLNKEKLSAKKTTNVAAAKRPQQKARPVNKQSSSRQRWHWQLVSRSQQSKNKITKKYEKMAVKTRLKSLRSADAGLIGPSDSSSRALRPRKDESGGEKKHGALAHWKRKKAIPPSKRVDLETAIPAVHLKPVIELDRDDVLSSTWLPLSEHQPLSTERRILLSGCHPGHRCCQQRAVEMYDNCTQWEDPVQLYKMLSASLESSSDQPQTAPPGPGGPLACGQLILNQNSQTGQPVQAFTVIQQPQGQHQMVLLQNVPGFSQQQSQGLDQSENAVQPVQSVGPVGHGVFQHNSCAVKQEQPCQTSKKVGRRKRGRKRKLQGVVPSNANDEKKPVDFAYFNPESFATQYGTVPYNWNAIHNHYNPSLSEELKSTGYHSYEPDCFKQNTQPYRDEQNTQPYRDVQSPAAFQQSKHTGLDLEPQDFEIAAATDESQEVEYNAPPSLEPKPRSSKPCTVQVANQSPSDSQSQHLASSPSYADSGETTSFQKKALVSLLIPQTGTSSQFPKIVPKGQVSQSTPQGQIPQILLSVPKVQTSQILQSASMTHVPPTSSMEPSPQSTPIIQTATKSTPVMTISVNTTPTPQVPVNAAVLKNLIYKTTPSIFISRNDANTQPQVPQKTATVTSDALLKILHHVATIQQSTPNQTKFTLLVPSQTSHNALAAQTTDIVTTTYTNKGSHQTVSQLQQTQEVTLGPQSISENSSAATCRAQTYETSAVTPPETCSQPSGEDTGGAGGFSQDYAVSQTNGFSQPSKQTTASAPKFDHATSNSSSTSLTNAQQSALPSSEKLSELDSRLQSLVPAAASSSTPRELPRQYNYSQNIAATFLRGRTAKFTEGSFNSPERTPTTSSAANYTESNLNYPCSPDISVVVLDSDSDNE